MEENFPKYVIAALCETALPGLFDVLFPCLKIIKKKVRELEKEHRRAERIIKGRE